MTTGRDLPPLLPLEYCRIDRAARMLECEMEDILHWGAIGAVDLAVNVSGLEGTLTFKISSLDDFALERVKSALTDEGAEESLIPHLYDAIDLAGQSLGPYAGATYSPRHEVRDLINRLIEELDQISPAELSENEYFEPDVSLKTTIHGMWNSYHLNSLQDRDEITIGPQNLGSFEGFGNIFTIPPFRPVGTLKSHKFLFKTNQSITVQKKDLWITKGCLSNLYKSITTGEVLPNIHNSAELAQRSKKQEEAAQQLSAPRITAKQSDLITALIDLHHTQEGKRLGDMGHQTFFKEILEPAFAAEGIQCPVTARSFDDWMQRARKFS